jgi:hypothetical protein
MWKGTYNKPFNTEPKRLRFAGNLFSPVKGTGTLKDTNHFVFVRIAQLLVADVQRIEVF